VWKDKMPDFDGLNQLIGTPELMARGQAPDRCYKTGN